MNIEKLNISNIETYLHSIMDGVVSEQTYAGTLPDTMKSEWNDMCLIDCGNKIHDFDAYGQGTILIWLYARPRSNGSKNVAIMSKLEENLNFVIKNASNKDYSISRGYTYTDYDATRQWHCNIVELNILIV
jgi:hypothetical protein